jgi:RNA polymerase sigma factor (sigma-70 family)
MIAAAQTPSAGERTLVRNAQAGDSAAYARLVRRHEPLAYRVAAFVAGPNHADEVTQVAFINAFRALHRFDPTRRFEPWLLRIVVNEARSARRSEGRQVALQSRTAAELAAPRGAEQPESRVLRTETRHALRAALARLPSKHREVVVCRYLLELSEEETSAVLGLRPGTVKSRLSRALARLRRELEDWGPRSEARAAA